LWVLLEPEIDIKEVLEPLAYSAVSLHDESGQKKDIYDYVKTAVYLDRKMQKWRDADKELVVTVLSEKRTECKNIVPSSAVGRLIHYRAG